jgi:hypothetical protein
VSGDIETSTKFIMTNFFLISVDLSTNVRDHSVMMSGGIFEVLLVEITQALDPKSRADYECTRYCLLVLANLAVSPANHPFLMKQALSVLFQYSKHRDIKCRQHALYCIANLCSSKDNVEEVVATGCLRTIITYAFPSSDSSANIQFQVSQMWMSCPCIHVYPCM